MLCKICNQKRATTRHIATHGLTYEDYLQTYDAERYYESKAINAINDLYVTVRYKFAEMRSSKGGQAYWITTKKGQERQFGLIDRDIKEHLEGRKTLGLYTPKNKTKFISFDIDKPDTSILENVVNALSAYVPEKNIYCSWSGNKGYHVEIFFDRLVDKTVVRKFYSMILSESGYDSKVVECRGDSGQAIKLPLGFNFKNKDIKTNYCHFVNKYGVSINDSQYGYLYISKIEKVPAELIYDAVDINYSPDFLTDEETLEVDELHDTVNTLPIYSGDIDVKRDGIERLLEEGIHQQGERHQSLFKIAVYLKDRGYTEDENKKYLFNWINKKCDPSLFTSSEEEIKKDITYTVECVYRNDYKLKANTRKITLNKMELKEVLSVTDKTLRKLYFILFTHCKGFGDTSGEFYMTYEQMGLAGATKNNRAQLKSQIGKLEALGKVEVVQSNVRAKGKLKSMPNRYRVKAYEPATTLDVKCFETCNQTTTQCLNCVSRELMNVKEIRQHFGRYSKDVLSTKCQK